MAGTVCVDASLAFVWILRDPLTARARLLRRRWLADSVRIFAPPIFRAELTSAIRKWLHWERISASHARDALERGLRLPVDFWDAGDALQRRALDIATDLKVSRAYDAQYLALAEFNEAEFWTADRRLAYSARHKFPWVRWIGDYQPS
jgi:predicted nucleic acid-binding protein